jgi:hypothetical protein
VLQISEAELLLSEAVIVYGLATIKYAQAEDLAKRLST